MENFQLQLLLKIIGLGSASGLLYSNNILLAIGDNSSFLYEYNFTNKQLQKHPIVENASENIIKKLKPDFEAITQYGDNIYIFGSGSTENRNIMIQLDAITKKPIATNDLSALYQTMQSFGEIKPSDFNLEGAIYDGNNWYLFNRGNGKKSKNAIFTIAGNNLTDDFSVIYNKIKLPKIKGIETTFTDAVWVNNKIYFLATAEDTQSTYDDGEVVGSIIGSINPETMKVEFTKKITKTAKLEGITVYEKSATSITFLLCEDNDTEVQESNFYLCKIEL
ncbi:DUF6929 family protein [Flavobacterium sp.]|uniref:DUF6929 family protein n=1 Tax=Flavobacterium sp. TaxID=239 RepID=UPI0037538050